MNERDEIMNKDRMINMMEDEISSLKTKVFDAERIRDKNYELYNKAQQDYKILRQRIFDEVTTFELKYLSLEEQYKKLRKYVKNKVLYQWIWFQVGCCVGITFAILNFFLSNILGLW